jgi:hypothetical protein
MVGVKVGAGWVSLKGQESALIREIFASVRGGGKPILWVNLLFAAAAGGDSFASCRPARALGCYGLGLFRMLHR